MSQPITVAQGPTVNRGLLAALGLGVDLSGEGASEWTNSPFTDPLDPEGKWRLGYKPVSAPCDRATALLTPRTCGPVIIDGETPEDDDPEDDEEPETPRVVVPDGGGHSSPPWVIGETMRPFEVLGPSIECSTFGLAADTDDEARNRALDAHRDLLWRALEHELWTGTQAQADSQASANRYLAHEDTPIVGTDLSLTRALYLLEAAMADCTSRDERVLIHVPWPLLEYFDCENLLHTTPNSDRYWTAAGSLIVAGTGYPGTLADGSGNEVGEGGELSVAIYATTRIRVMLGKAHLQQGEAPISGGDAINVATNDVALQARQSAALTFACCAVGATIAI